MTDTLVWISGASSGIGAALARSVPYDDPHVVDISRSGGTPGTEHLPADLADPAAWSAVAAHFRARIAQFVGRRSRSASSSAEPGSAEFTGQRSRSAASSAAPGPAAPSDRRVVFVHAAGVLEPIGFSGEVDHGAYRHAVLLNAAAPQVLGDAFLAALHAAGFAGHADVVLISSGAASTPYEGWSAYCAGKAAGDMWVRTAGAEQARRHGGRRRILAVGPGVVDTAMQTRIRETDAHDFPQVDRFHRLHDEGQLLAPDDSAERVWALITGDAESGSILDVRDAY